MTLKGRRAAALAPLASIVGLAWACSPPATAVGSPSPRHVAATASAGGAHLRPVGRVTVPGGGVIHRYQQRAGGLPVLDAEAVVVEPPQGRATAVADSTVAGVVVPGGARAISPGAAIRAARRATHTKRLRAPARARLGIDPGSRALAWQVSLPAADPVADLLVVIDARRGERIEVRDLLRKATGNAMIFDPTPVTTQGGYTGLRDDRDRNSPLLTSLRRPVALQRIRSSRGCLRGRYVDVRLGSGAERVCQPGLNFTGLTRARERFEAVMDYYHIDRTRAYVDGLGLSESLRAKPQRVRADAITADNSYFSPMTRSMTFGTGGVDDGEDADVIVHEYGHSLQDHAVRGFGRSPAGAALGEGFGDYLAASMSELTTGGSLFDACIFDWDATSYSGSGCGRRADKPIDRKTAERRCRREPHCTGKAWSSLLWFLRATLGDDPQGRSIMDRIVLESHFMYARRSGFRDAARALLAADGLLYAGAHRATLGAALAARRFCPASGC